MQKSLASKDSDSKLFPIVVFNYHQMKDSIISHEKISILTSFHIETGKG